MELLVGLVELGGEYRTSCMKCDKNATVYVVDPITEEPKYFCTRDVGPEIEANLLRFIG